MGHGATQVRKTRDEVQADLTKLRNVIDDLVAHGWGGSASVEFHQVMGRWDTSSKKLMVSLEEIAKILDTTKEKFSVNEAQQRALMGQSRDYSGALGQKL